MTDEMKLLMALCDALGFEVDVIKNKYHYPHEANTINLEVHGWDENGPYRVADKNYKLTKKPSEEG